MRIKKFNELFDSEELKSINEIDYLTGHIRDIINNMDIALDFKNESVPNLIHKLIKYNFPYLRVFTEHPNGYDFSNFTTRISHAEELEDYWVLILESDETEITIALGLKTNSTNDYNVVLFVEEDGSPVATEYQNLDYSELVSFIKDDYTMMVVENEFDELFGFDDSIVDVNN